MKNIKIIIPVVLLALAGVYKFVLAKPPAKAEEPNVKGEIYVLPTDFLVNLSGGQFAKFSVAIVFAEGHSAIPHAEVAAPEVHAASAAAPEPPEGYGVLTQEPLVRAIITDVVTGETAEHLKSSEGREKIYKKILKRLKKETDVHAHEIYFTDVVVQ
jgi:flagellar basal body-associated protein FliL